MRPFPKYIKGGRTLVGCRTCLCEGDCRWKEKRGIRSGRPFHLCHLCRVTMEENRRKSLANRNGDLSPNGNGKLPPSELARRLMLLALWLPDWKDAKLEDHLRRVQRARDHGVEIETYSAFAETRRPPGIYPPYSSRPAGRKRSTKKTGPRQFHDPWCEV